MKKTDKSKLLVYWLLGIFAFELLVAFFPFRGLGLSASSFNWLTNFTASIIPVIRKVDEHMTPDFEARRLYMTMLFSLFPLKVVLIYQ